MRGKTLYTGRRLRKHLTCLLLLAYRHGNRMSSWECQGFCLTSHTHSCAGFFFFVCMCVIKDCAKEFISRLSRFIFLGFGSSAIFSRCESLQPQFSFCRSSLCYTYTSHLGVGIPLLPCWWSCLRLVAGFTCCLLPQLVCLCARLQSKKKKKKKGCIVVARIQRNKEHLWRNSPLLIVTYYGLYGAFEVVTLWYTCRKK